MSNHASPSSLSNWWRRLCSSIVQDLPLGLDYCESCREIDCSPERWEHCAARLAYAAEVAGLGESPPQVARTDEMPAVEGGEGALPIVMQDDEAATEELRRRNRAG
jgi:hypothetical protein